MDTILSSIINTTGRVDMLIIFKFFKLKKNIFPLTFTNFCISTLILRVEMMVFVIHNC